MHLIALILASLPAPGGGASSSTDQIAPPPGMVLIPGGRTKIGSSQRDIERLLSDNETLKAQASSLLGETPQHTVDVEDFFLMVTEVTNEQYAAFVRATGARPPQHWAGAAVDVARAEFLKKDAEERAKAEAARQPVPERRVFDAKTWWLRNWRDHPWSIPAGLECKPVVWVDHQDVLGYAQWAGMRLMSELEYQRAVRGDSDRSYPWGDRWEDGKYAATSEVRRINDVQVAGSFPDGASEQGVFDLAGNAWEWTSSRYEPFPGFKQFKVTLGKGRAREVLDTMPGFNADHRVVVGGSVQNTKSIARATFRRGTSRDTQTNALGFRCAASVHPGRDIAETLMRELSPELRPRDQSGPIAYDPRLCIALDRWTSSPSPTCAVPSYAVPEGYDYIVFTPIEQTFAVTMKDLRDFSLAEHLAPIGFFATNQRIIEPPIEPGTYVVLFRGRGEPPRVRERPAATPDGQEVEAAAPLSPFAIQLEQHLTFDSKVDNLVLLDSSGAPVVVLPVPGIDLGNPERGSVQFVTRTVKVPDGEKMTDEDQRWLELRLVVPGRARKALKGDVHLRFAEGVAELDWRQ